MRQFLENMTGLSVYPMASLFIFGCIFLIAVVRTFTISKSLLVEMEELPLDKNVEPHKTSDVR